MADAIEGPGKPINFYGMRYAVSYFFVSSFGALFLFSYGTAIGSYFINSRSLLRVFGMLSECSL